MLLVFFNMESLLECFRGELGTITITLFVYSLLTTLLLIILLWILKNNFKRDKGERES
jgi:hypothetical protein